MEYLSLVVLRLAFKFSSCNSTRILVEYLEQTGLESKDTTHGCRQNSNE